MWRKHAENVTASPVQGDRVVVVGMLKQRSWENDAGEKRYAVEMDIEEIGPGLRYAEACRSRTRSRARTSAHHPCRVWQVRLRPVGDVPPRRSRRATNPRSDDCLL